MFKIFKNNLEISCCLATSSGLKIEQKNVSEGKQIMLKNKLNTYTRGMIAAAEILLLRHKACQSAVSCQAFSSVTRLFKFLKIFKWHQHKM